MTDAAQTELEALRAELATAQAKAAEAEAWVASLKAKASNDTALIATLKLEIEKLRRALFGQRSERKARLLDQLELQLEELEATAAEDDALADEAAAKATQVRSFTRKVPSRKPFPEHLPRERVVVAAPEACTCCGSHRLRKLGEDVTETLEVPDAYEGPHAGAHEPGGEAAGARSFSERHRGCLQGRGRAVVVEDGGVQSAARCKPSERTSIRSTKPPRPDSPAR